MRTGDTELLLKGSDLYRQIMASLEKAEAAIARCNEQLERSRFALRQHAKRGADISLLPVIRLRLHDGRLPSVASPIIYGHPPDRLREPASGTAPPFTRVSVIAHRGLLV